MIHRRYYGRRDGDESGDNDAAALRTNSLVSSSPTSAAPRPSSFLFLSALCQALKKLRSEKTKKRCIILVLCFFAILRPVSIVLFGPRGSPIGGVLGIFIDSQLRHYLFRREVQRWMNELQEEGIDLPDTDAQSNIRGAKLKTLPHFALGLTMQREARRKKGVNTDMRLRNRTISAGKLDVLSSWVENSQNIHVTITESRQASSLNLVPKISLQEQMRKRLWCEQNWLCFRCLKAPNYGSYPRCSLVCGKCARDLICNTPRDPPRTTIDMSVRVHTADRADAWLIPRIIHQTWYEDITPDRYPQLVRLQNSWKNAGWEYRFYDDAAVVEFIEANFPSRFLRAYQSLTPGAYKADFFRYLVLMKDGGIYADVDVILDTNLDSFVTPTMGFFVPRDSVGAQIDENFCLWNGLIGSAPAHPFMIRAVERMMNLVLNRADLYDMEREICQNSNFSGETWKTRIEPNLLLSGPCALGVAVNEAIGNDPVTKFDIGFTLQPTPGTENPHLSGDTLILGLDKNDLGALRMSDIDRNIIVASTDLPGLSKDPIESPALGKRKAIIGAKGVGTSAKRPPHYSLAGKGDWVWGTQYVYTDALTANEIIKLNIITSRD